MRWLVCVVFAVAACGGDDGETPHDAAPGIDARAIDAPADAPMIDAPQMADPSHSTLTVDRTMAVVGADTVTVTVVLHDASDAPVAGVAVSIGATGMANDFDAPPLTDATGTTSAHWTSTRAEIKHPTALLPGVAGTLVGPDVTFLAGPVATFAFVQQPVDTIEDHAIAVALAAADQYSNPVDGDVHVALGQDPSGALLGGPTDAALAGGAVTFGALVIAVPANGYTLTAQLGALSIESDPFDIVHDVDACIPDLGGPPWRPVGDLIDSSQFVDVDGDGRLDALIAASSGPRLALGVPGGFGPVHAVAFGAPYLIVVGDVNGDGKQDLAMLGGSSAIDIAIGVGGGDFTPGTSVAASASDIVLADFDGDGALDLASLWMSVLSLRHGNGDGTFAAPTTKSVPRAQRIVAHDVNGDGKTDLIVGYDYAATTFFDVRLGNGNGTFAAPIAVQTDQDEGLVALFDVTGDGIADLVAVGDTHVNVLVGHANGTFTQTAAWDEPDHVWAIARADLDGDGRPELLLSEHDVRAVHNAGAGAFTPANTTILGTAPAATLAIQDVDGDGHPDLLEAGGAVGFVPGLPTGGFRVPLRSVVPLATGHEAETGIVDRASADLNLDGHPDLLWWNGQHLTAVMGQSGGGGLARAYESATMIYAPAAALGDFDHDGDPDVAYVDQSDPSVFLYRTGAAGAFTVRPPISLGSSSQPTKIATADLDGDGNLDLVFYASAEYELYVARGLGTGAFGAPQPLLSFLSTPSGPFGIALIDVDGDGDLDFVTTTTDGVLIAANTGAGALGPLTLVPTLATLRLEAAGDFDGDGVLDLAVSLYGQIGVARGLGGGAFAAPTLTTVAAGFSFVFSDVTAVDFDGDGALDLVGYAGSNFLLQGLGNGKFGPPRYYGFATGARYPGLASVIVEDRDGEGEPDLAFGTEDALMVVTQRRPTSCP